jgi:SAM-dependent methyltransferase
MQNNVELMRVAYDRIVADYDSRWSVHVEEPQRRLTRELRLLPGDRCADLGCGTGIDTLELIKLAAPGEVVGVDLSPGMLETAAARARSAGYSLTTLCEGADEFIANADDASFDVLSLRFCLGYLDWRPPFPAPHGCFAQAVASAFSRFSQAALHRRTRRTSKWCRSSGCPTFRSPPSHRSIRSQSDSLLVEW